MDKYCSYILPEQAFGTHAENISKYGERGAAQVCTVPGDAATCSEGFVYFFFRVPQAVGLYCSCHAAQASKGNLAALPSTAVGHAVATNFRYTVGIA